MLPGELLQPLTIRNLTLPNRVFQAPLAGYSNMPFRYLCWKLGRPGFLATEMISAQSLCIGGRKVQFYIKRHPEEGPLQYQLWGTNPKYLAEAARICAAEGADLVDLNCGCPVRKVTASGSGVAIMKTPDIIAACVTAMRAAIDIPLTVKIRIGPNNDWRNGLEVAHLVEDAGADLLTVHGRHGKESYSTPVRCEPIAEIVSSLNIPVVGNGDVIDGKSAAYLVENTGCAGVMVARGCMGNPWVFGHIKTELGGESWTPPTEAERGEILLENYRMLVEIMGEYQATRHIRKLACFYSKGLAGSREFRVGVNRCQNADDFTKHVQHHFKQTKED